MLVSYLTINLQCHKILSTMIYAQAHPARSATLSEYTVEQL